MSNSAGEKTEFGPGKTALYYNNKGLFSDPFLEDRLPNLEKYYNNPSTRFLNDYWNIDESNSTKYNEAFQRVMDLWNKLDQNVPKFCSKERQVQNTWIDPIFRILGWEIELEEASSKNGVTNFPDYALFASLEDWKKSKDLSGNNKFKKATAVADAKDWGVSLDGKGFSNKNPSFQIINYLKQTDKNWGILTDGKYWRIYSLRSDSKHTTFYEIDLEKILASGDFQRFKYFYNFFRAEAFIVDAKLSDRSFLDFVFEDGKFYSQSVEKNLHERVYKVANSICQGVLVNYTNPSEQDLKQIYENSMYYLFKLMFVLNCESKGLLEVNKQDDYYEFSLRKRCLEIKEQLEQGKNWSSQPKSYNYINDLFELLKAGDQKIGVHGFGNEPFEIGNLKFFSKNKIGDDFLNTALLDLACDRDDEGNLQFIDYKILSPDHIGSLFEGLLEFNLVTSGKQYDLVNNKGERKSTGSYYTPDYVADYIISESLKHEVEGKNPKEILNLKVLDPAMGSGHFLLGVVKYLEDTIIQLQNTDSKIKGAIQFEEIRKEVLKNCVYGIDINPLAAQLAKFSLWIHTSQKGDYLEPLSDQLICADTLIDEKIWKEFANGSKFDVLVGNPPYISELRNNKMLFEKYRKHPLTRSYYESKMDIFHFFIQRGLDLVKDDGYIGYIIPQYWLTRSNTVLLHKKITEDSSITRMIDFGTNKVFPSAPGMHSSILILKKAKAEKGIEAKIEGSTVDGLEIQAALQKAKFTPLSISYNHEIGRFTRKVKLEKGTWFLEDDTMAQGVVAPQEYVIKGHLEKIKAKVGDGIFVLSDAELTKLNLNKDEKKLIKPFIEASDLEAPKTIDWQKKWIIYTGSSHNKALLEKRLKLPNIQKHLDKYSQINTSSNAPYGLHRARTANLFEGGSKILSVRKGKRQRFVWTNKEMVVNQAVIVIQSGSEWLDKLLALYLNSNEAYEFFKNTKAQGDIVQVDKEVLLRAPLPEFLKNIYKTPANERKVEKWLLEYDPNTIWEQLQECSQERKAA